jgi:hypothetical protein
VAAETIRAGHDQQFLIQVGHATLHKAIMPTTMTNEAGQLNER